MPKYTIEFEDTDIFYEHANAIIDVRKKTELLDDIYGISRSINKHGGTPDQIDSAMQRIQHLAYEATQPWPNNKYLIATFITATAALIAQYFILTR